MCSLRLRPFSLLDRVKIRRVDVILNASSITFMIVNIDFPLNEEQRRAIGSALQRRRKKWSLSKSRKTLHFYLSELAVILGITENTCRKYLCEDKLAVGKLTLRELIDFIQRRGRADI